MRERRYPLSSTASGLPAHQCAGRIAPTGKGRGRLVGCASATRVLRVVITRHLQPARTTLRPPPPSPLPSPPPTCPTALDRRGEARGGLVGRGLGRAGDEAKGCRGMGGHSIDFVQDSRRRRRRRRGQPDPPLVVPTRLQHRPPPHIPPRLVSYSFSFEHTTARPRAPLVPLVLSLAFSSLSLSVPFPLCLSSNLRYPLAVSYSHRALDKMLRKPHTSAKYPLRRAVLSICTGIKRIVHSIRGPRITRTTRDFDNALVILITYSRQSLF